MLWVREQAAKFPGGKHRDVCAGIRRRAGTWGYGPAGRAGADECARYLESEQDYLDCPALPQAGWPVASGLIEGAARWLRNDRVEVTGARWSLDGAEAVLNLPALGSRRSALPRLSRRWLPAVRSGWLFRKDRFPGRERCAHARRLPDRGA